MPREQWRPSAAYRPYDALYCFCKPKHCEGRYGISRVRGIDATRCSVTPPYTWARAIQAIIDTWLFMFVQTGGPRWGRMKYHFGGTPLGACSTYGLHLQPEPSLQQCWGWCVSCLEPWCRYLFRGKQPNTKFRIAPRACVRCLRNSVIIFALAAQSDSPSIRNYRKAKRFFIECSVYS